MNPTHSVTLNWTAAPGATSYYVYRGTASGKESGTPINATPITGTSYVDTTVVAGDTYFYYVTSMNASGQSVPSAEVTGTIPNPLEPPTNLTITVV